MRMRFLKLAGFILWGIFLFAPFVVKADEGFDTYMSMDEVIAATQDDEVIFSVGGYELKFDDSDPFRIPLEDKWSVKLKAGKDSVLKHDLPAHIQNDRIQLDDGGNRGLRFGVGLNYSL